MIFPSKSIVVVYNGKIPVLGGVHGPILSPFQCKISIIEQLIEMQAHVYEVLGTSKIRLTRANYDQDNGGAMESAPAKDTVIVDNQPTEKPNTDTIRDGSTHMNDKFQWNSPTVDSPVDNEAESTNVDGTV